MQWTDLAASLAPFRDDGLSDLAYLPEEAADADERRRAEVFSGFAGTVFSLALFDGPAVLADVAGVVAETAEGVAAALDPVPTLFPAPLSLLAFQAALGCAGLAAEPVDRYERWLTRYAARAPQLVPLTREYVLVAATGAGLAGAARDVAAVIRKGRAVGAPPFRGDVEALAAYLADAVARGATRTDVEPAWVEFRDAFPTLKKVERVRWEHLVWISRVVIHVLGGVPVGEVVDTLRAEVLP